ncbi:hypothetical protein BA_1097 [Bacillus anthracis str. Ames]|uniref:Uncharacterized protein n=2 Tax=Bacillus anthracis TaxID=1392 RepID=Q81TZ7_BACAN|nr:hypothetical protein BA_1097 [Bacillus anthracis str. Ames]AAT30195.1 hypothetical protein GBAA_1097 [Bacillus anthracis str. 'Ames Ancestor']EDR17984.1 hypothetical protein BAC_1120 [Bacillus anthracis str. A0488]EDR87228.1 hypothetical protein BAQ_1150 [Bacillus anthracis str. A0193]EDR91980.1 hypothetical protein BAH_1152 [Bacillus anthracis str. A0442]EDS96351.1 hypothetical protein BAK_1187 [Bacillus anthracis str. A0389]EDT18733.1 hypothetical protein BAM_1135 [Bacillus anthracis str
MWKEGLLSALLSLCINGFWVVESEGQTIITATFAVTSLR